MTNLSLDFLPLINGVALFLSFFFALIRRCYRTTSTAEYHGVFEKNGEKDESEKIHRIDLMLWILQFLIQSVWVGSLLVLSAEGKAWYSGVLESTGIQTWWAVFWLLEVMILGLVIIELLPEAISMWIGDARRNREFESGG